MSLSKYWFSPGRQEIVPIAQLVERPVSECEVVGSNPGCTIPKVEKMVLAAPLLTLA